MSNYNTPVATDVESLIRTAIDNNVYWFETSVLATVATNIKYFTEIAGILCVDAVTGKFSNDFSTPMDNALYETIKMYNTAMCAAPRFNPMPYDFAAVLLKQLSSQGHMLGESEIPQVLNRLQEVYACSQSNPTDTVRSGFSYWLKNRRVSLAYAQRAYTGATDADSFLEQIRKQALSVETSHVNKNQHQFGAGVKENRPPIDRLSTTLTALDAALGGGWGKGEGYLVIAATGVGKTVLATQLAADFAAGGAKGILITTEQPHNELEPRIISNKCGIPFSLIKDGLNMAMLQPDQLVSYERLVAHMSQNLIIVDWLGDKVRAVETDLEREVDQAVATLGRVDFVILDWLGSAIGAGTNDKDKLRLTYQMAADKMARLALTRGIATISFAQAHPSLGFDRGNVDSSCLSENKTLGRNMTGIIGISGFRKKSDEESTHVLFETDQCFYISKGRKSEGGRVPFKRFFNYQRIECTKRG